MSHYADLDLKTLLDFLVQYTLKYTQMMSLGGYSVEEITQCKETLRELQRAIAARQGKPTDFISDDSASTGMVA